jgi:hypothetical protein
MRPKDEDPLLTLVKELDRLHDLQIDDAVRDMVWKLICDLQDYRWKKGREGEQTA